jgi:hypothetical protein
MPIKSKNIGMDLVNNTPLVEQIQNESHVDAVDDMMSEIISERTKIKATAALNMVGALTPVTYYQVVGDSTNNYATDANGPSDIAFDTKKFIEIKDFRVHLTNATNLENEGTEEEKSYIFNGSLQILPRTIKPNIGDMFIMKYYDRYMCYQISSVDVKSYEQDSGFECDYTLYKADYKMPETQIAEKKIYRHELVGTTYRPILTSNELEYLKKFKKLYAHIESVYNNLFYDRNIDGYMYRNYDKDKYNYQIKDNININTLGKRGGLYRANYESDTFTHQNVPHKIHIEEKCYDNLLNIFMTRNRIFRDFDGVLLSVQPLLGDDRVGYKRSIFGCLEAQSIANYKNTFVLPSSIDILTPEINSYLVGKMNALHMDHPDPLFHNDYEFFPESLSNQLKCGNKKDMNEKFGSKMYNSIDSILIETIVRFIYDVTDDFTERFLHLYDHMDDLYEHNISYANIFYLFPLIGYILEKKLEEMYSDNIELE